MSNRTITPEIKKFSEICLQNMKIKSELYTEYHVKRGLRDQDGNGVLVGITDISGL